MAFSGDYLSNQRHTFFDTAPGSVCRCTEPGRSWLQSARRRLIQKSAPSEFDMLHAFPLSPCAPNECNAAFDYLFASIFCLTMALPTFSYWCVFPCVTWSNLCHLGLFENVPVPKLFSINVEYLIEKVSYDDIYNRFTGKSFIHSYLVWPRGFYFSWLLQHMALSGSW